MARAFISGGVAVLLAAVVGCGGSTPSSNGGLGIPTRPGSSAASSPATTKLPDPCALLSAAELTPLMADPSSGHISSPAPKASDPPYRECHWTSTDPNATSTLAGVTVGVSAPGEGGVDYLGILTATFLQEPDTTSSSVGTDGHVIGHYIMSGAGGIGKSIVFKKGNLTVIVSAGGESVDLGALQTAATHALGALP